MAVTQKYIDSRMIEDYSSIHKQIKAVNVILKDLRKTMLMWNDQMQGGSRHIIEPDLSHILDSIENIQKSCESLYSDNMGLGNHFIAYTSFYREILSTMKLIMMKISHFHKTTLQNDLYASKKYSDLQIFFQKEFRWRNQLEHDIDPFYDGGYDEISQAFRIHKVTSFMKTVVKLLSYLDRQNVGEIQLSVYDPDYDKLSLLRRKEILHQYNKVAILVFTMINELSLKVMKQPPDEKLLILLNLAMKYLEFGKLIKYTYNLSHEHHAKKDKEFTYFSRVGLTFCYQFYDKLGLYVKDRYSLTSRTTYFKDNIKTAKEEIKNWDEILQRCMNIEVSSEYKLLNKTRQAICHKNKGVDYRSSSESISSLLVRHYASMVELMELIMNEYCTKHNIQLSIRSIEETQIRTTIFEL